MKRVHRKWHRRAWLWVAAGAALLITLALWHRADVLVNNPWPALLAAPAVKAGR
jgi:hypothetical protein